MGEVTRRKAIAGIAAGGAGLAFTNFVGAEAGGQSPTAAPAFRGGHQPKPLPFDPARLKGLSEKLIRSHWENNYGGSVRALNAVEQRLGGDNRPGGEVLEAVKQWFGGYERWEAEFRMTANALGGGSGWAVLTYNLHTGELHNYWAWDHMHNAPAGRPLLVLDMYEHSYHMDYGAAAAKYVDAFMQNVNWEEVNRRFVGARKMAALV